MRLLQTESEWPSDVELLKRVVRRLQVRREWVSIVSLLGGLALPLVHQTRESLVFGIMTAVWGALDLIAFAFAKRTVPPSLAWLATAAFVGQAINLLSSLVAVGFLFLSQDLNVRGSAAAVLLQTAYLSWSDALFMRAVAGAMKDQD